MQASEYASSLALSTRPNSTKINIHWLPDDEGQQAFQECASAAGGRAGTYRYERGRGISDF